jgi:hypothetical protein
VRRSDGFCDRDAQATGGAQQDLRSMIGDRTAPRVIPERGKT